MPARGAGGGHAARKSCNCKNSRCLKLYCECFASGRYCENCNCSNCCNNRENEHVRQPAVDAILERNPNAFRPKIQAQDELAGSSAPRHALPSDGVGKHSKGCNCKKSACLKKYCECFQAGVYCSDFCKCADCKNFDGSEQRAQVIACLNMQPMPAYHAPNDFTSPHSHLREPASGVSPLKRPRPNVPPLPLGYGGTPLQLGASSGIVPGSAQAQAAAALAARGLPPLLGGGLNPGNIASALTLPQLLGLSSQQALGNFGGLLGLPQGAGAQAGTSQLGGGAQLPFHSAVAELVRRNDPGELCKLLYLVADEEAEKHSRGEETSSLDAGQEKAVLSETLALLSKLTKGAGQKVGQTSETPPDADRIVAAINQSQQAVQTTQGMTAEQRISQLQQANSAAAMASSLGLPILAPPVMPASTPQGVLGGSMGLLQGTALAGLTGSGVVGTPSAGAAADAASTQQVIAAVAAAAAAAAAASAGDAGAGSAPDAGTGAMPPADALTAMQSLVGLLGPNPMDPSSTPAAVAGTAGSVGPDAGAPAEPVQLPVKLEVNSDVAAS